MIIERVFSKHEVCNYVDNLLYVSYKNHRIFFGTGSTTQNGELMTISELQKELIPLDCNLGIRFFINI